jgi:hypothetical protein
LSFELNFEVETAVGSDKGGSAPLYFGAKYNMGNIIVGNPQASIADLSKNTQGKLLFTY